MPLPVDYGAAIAHLQTDPVIAKLIDQVGPCRLDQVQQSGDLLYCLTRTIIHQQLSIKAAATIHRRFLALYGDRPPTAAAVLATADDQLRNAGLSRSKAAYVKDIALKVETLPGLEALTQLPDTKIVELLTSIKGIGRWSAQMVLIFRLHRWDVWPDDDLGIQNALQRLHGLEERPRKRQTAEFGNAWSPYRSVAAWYLWRSLEMDSWG